MNSINLKRKIFIVSLMVVLIGVSVSICVSVYDGLQIARQTTTNHLTSTTKNNIIHTTNSKGANKPLTSLTNTTTTTTTTLMSTTDDKRSFAMDADFGVFKSYTDYKCLARNSEQWKIQERAYTDECGLRKIGDDYLVALGSYFGTELGSRYMITLSNGSVFTVVLCDWKDDAHTDSTHKYTVSNGCAVEFYVETSMLPEDVRVMGTIGQIPFFSGSVAHIKEI